MKAVQLTDAEIMIVIQSYSYNFNSDDASNWTDKIERMRYLNKRLNDGKVETPVEEKKEWGSANG
jgi:hypothetical protein